MIFQTEQEKFWSGKFGETYIKRNKKASLLASNLNFFSQSLRLTRKLNDCLEFGANIGMNLMALKLLHPGLKMHGVEINKKAASELSRVIPQKNIYQGSILNYDSKTKFDLVLLKGVLIHINPDVLEKVYKKIISATRKYLLIAEYYNPNPVMVPYRGHADRLYKRDFAGEILKRNPTFSLVDYGFIYRYDPQFPQDDITWFLMEKK